MLKQLPQPEKMKEGRSAGAGMWPRPRIPCGALPPTELPRSSQRGRYAWPGLDDTNSGPKGHRGMPVEHTHT